MPQIEVCAEKTQYYHPLVFFMDNKQDAQRVLLQAAQELREINIFLACRGQMAIQQKDFNRAAKCSELLLKLSNLLDKSPFFISGFIACYGRKSAFELESQLANKSNWPAEKIEKRIALFRQYEPMPMFVERMNWGERPMALDAIRIGMQDRLLLNPNPLFGQNDRRAITQNQLGWFSKVELYRSINRHIDNVIEYMDPHDERNYNKDRRLTGERYIHFLGNYSSFEWTMYFLSGRKIRSRYLAEFIVASRMTDADLQVRIEASRFMYDRLTQVAWHTALYRTRKNTLPKSMNDLKDEYPDLELTDMFSYQEPFLFKSNADSDQCRLEIYSRGSNWRDNTHPDPSEYKYLSPEGFERMKRDSDDIVVAFGE